MKEKGYICENGSLRKEKVDYNLYGVFIGKFDAEVCDKCQETFFDEPISKKMTEIVEIYPEGKNKLIISI